jgi:3-oxochol-4-en-24-oyl-CoA dehydrogenase
VRASVAQIAAVPEPDRLHALVDAGYAVPGWPAPHGVGASPALQLLIDEELAAAGIARPDLVIAGWALPTIVEHGSAEQVERFVRPTLYGELVWCQLFSEPDAGSDLAALRTRAERVEGGWRLTGQKVWTSLAHRADWGICLARTDADAPKHRGITYFLVDMRSPGIDIRPLREITGEERFNEVFLDGVLVPDDLVVGAVGDGWRLARTTLAHERVAIGAGPSIGDDTERLVARLAGVAHDAVVAGRLGGLVADGLAGSLLDLRATLMQLHGRPADSASSVRKLLGVRHRQQVADLAFDVAGADALSTGDEAFDVLLVRALSIAGGTTQVLRNVVAERLLGLPRD